MFWSGTRTADCISKSGLAKHDKSRWRGATRKPLSRSNEGEVSTLLLRLRARLIPARHRPGKSF
eukprot:6091457-Alexandrium_andersonii.AAC.1